MLKNLFGSKKTSGPTTVSQASTVRASDPQNTIVKLKESIENQEKRHGHLNRKIEQVVQEAKSKLAKGDKKGALFAMKRKKLFEQEIDKIENVKMTLETQVCVCITEVQPTYCSSRSLTSKAQLRMRKHSRQ